MGPSRWSLCLCHVARPGSEQLLSVRAHEAELRRPLPGGGGFIRGRRSGVCTHAHAAFRHPTWPRACGGCIQPPWLSASFDFCPFLSPSPIFLFTCFASFRPW